MALNKAEILRQSRVLNKHEMKKLIMQMLDRTKRMSNSEFEKILRNVIPEESYYQTKILEWLREEYPTAFVWKAAAGPYSQGGIPDVCAVIDGKYYGFEVKRPYLGVTSQLQKQTIKKIIAAGGVAAVVTFVEDVEAVIQSVKQSVTKNN